MKARTGFVLFMVTFLIIAMVPLMVEGLLRFLQRILQPFWITAERLSRIHSLLQIRINMTEWKNFIQRAS